jgi:hypothetical protein
VLSLKSKDIDALGVFLLPGSHHGFLPALLSLNQKFHLFGVEEFLVKENNRGFESLIDGALEYHERPDRELVIQEVRGRWRPGAAPAPRPKQASPSNAGAGRPDESESANNSSHKRGPHMAVVAVLAVLTVAALIYTLWAPEVEAKIGVYTKVISAAKNAAVDPAPAPAPAPAPVPAPSAPAKAAAKPAPIHTDAAASAPARPARTETPAPLPPAPAASVAPPVVRGPVASVVTHPAPAVVTQPRPAFNSAPALMAWPDEENAVVFDAAQTDVVPPTVLNPDMMKQLVPEDGPKTGGSIELVINERGTIDDVKGRPPPRTLAQSMQMMADLSVAKNWKFRPALKDGRPVKYRLVVFR